MVRQRKNSVFVDSNYFIALRNPLDTSNVKANKYAEYLVNFPVKLIISHYIFSEIVTLVSQKLGKSEAIRSGNDLISDQDIQIVQTTRNIEEATWKIFCEIKKKNMSYVDCNSLAIMKQYDINTFLTFDTTDFSSLRKEYKFEFF